MLLPIVLVASALRLAPAIAALPWPAPNIVADVIGLLGRPMSGKAVPTYDGATRSVSNWRDDAATTLEPKPLSVAAALIDADRPVVTRCVKLNNPWCIKRAHWEGEIGADDEDHTAFATTADGADAAVALLRTYYVDHRRHSALDIVRRWAPAECRPGEGGGLSVGLAIRGLANTLRGRFLLTHSRGGTSRRRTGRGRSAGRGGGRVRMTISVVPVQPLPAYHVPDIAAGMGEHPAIRVPPSRSNARQATSPARLAARGALRPVPSASARALASSEPAARPPALFCGTGEQRIQNYAREIAKVLGKPSNGDLELFDAAGRPRPNLLPVLVAMSGVELGYLHAGPQLVEAAMERMTERLAQAEPEAATGPARTAIEKP